MKLVALPAFTDNYIWMIHNGVDALVVDPGDATPVLQALKAHRLSLRAILVTHHHMDHVAGLAELISQRGHELQGRVHGPALHQLAEVGHAVSEGDKLSALDLDITVWDTPGHTDNHVSYLLTMPDGDHAGHPLLFCGDTLFSAGCGRIFDGTPEQFSDALERFRRLPADTVICCTHEYTLSNLAFAQAVEPDNAQIAHARTRCEALRAQSLPTLPALMGSELEINPFLRCHQPTVMAQALAHGAADASPLSVFTQLRQWKNQFKA
jgi:hydroxyacylglutathione hydrolase